MNVLPQNQPSSFQGDLLVDRQIDSPANSRLVDQRIVERSSNSIWSALLWIALVSIPGTPQNKASLEKTKSINLRRKMARFEGLERLDLEKKEVLRPFVLNYQTQLIDAELALQWFLLLPLLVFGIGEIVLYELMWTPIVTALRLPITSPRAEGYLSAKDLGLLWVGLLVILLVVPPILLIFSKAPFTRYQKKVMSIGWYSIIFVVYMFLLYHNLALPKHPVSDPLTWVTKTSVSLLFASTNMVFLLLILFILAAMLRRGKRINYPIATLMDCLISILAKEEGYPDKWSQIEYKQSLLVDLERSAVCFERYLLDKLFDGVDKDLVVDSWMRSTMQEVAAALRQKKTWILTPQRDTCDYFFSSIAATLCCVIEGNWHELEKAKPEKSSRTNLWRTRLINSLRVVFSAALPIALFLLFQYAFGGFNEPIRDYVAVVAFGWGLIVVIASISPNFGIYVSAVKDIVGLLPLKNDKP
jgi:hypothetical protein